MESNAWAVSATTATATILFTTEATAVPVSDTKATAVGALTLVNITGNTFVCTGMTTNSASANESAVVSGSIALSGTLDRVRITTVNGTDTFDAGTINILVE